MNFCFDIWTIKNKNLVEICLLLSKVRVRVSFFFSKIVLIKYFYKFWYKIFLFVLLNIATGLKWIHYFCREFSSNVFKFSKVLINTWVWFLIRKLVTIWMCPPWTWVRLRKLLVVESFTLYQRSMQWNPLSSNLPRRKRMCLSW